MLNKTSKYIAPKGYRRLRVNEILRKDDIYVNYVELKPTVSVGRKVLYPDMVYIRAVDKSKVITKLLNLKLTVYQAKILKLLLNNTKNDNLEHIKRNNPHHLNAELLEIAAKEFNSAGMNGNAIWDKLDNLLKNE